MFKLFILYLILVANTLRREANGTKLKNSSDEFTYLLKGGYRPSHHSLAKYVVSLRYSTPKKYFGDNHYCGGVIISKNLVLTAAHCFRGNKAPNFFGYVPVRVVAGTPRRLQRWPKTTEVSIRKVEKHKDFDEDFLHNDIAILHLDKNLEKDFEYIDEIDITDTEPEPGTPCTTLGWGRIDFMAPLVDEILHVNISICPESFCSQFIDDYNPGMICARDRGDYEKDACTADSGGPLICDNKVAGIVSFGFECGLPNAAGVYTNIQYYRDWIKANHGYRNFEMWNLIVFLLLEYIIFLIN